MTMLLIAALTAMGVPDITWSEYQLETTKRKAAESREAQVKREGETAVQEERKGREKAEAAAKACFDQAEAERESRRVAELAVERERQRRIKSESEAKTALAQIGTERTRRRAAEFAVEQEQRRRKKAEDLLSRGRAIDVVIAVDCSGSMGNVIDELRSCIDILAVVGPALCTRFRLGIVAYRENVAVLPLSELDQRGLARWKRFAYENTALTEVKEHLADPAGRMVMLPELHAVNSIARIDRGIRRALLELSSSSKDVRQCLILAGDMGPWETNALRTIDRHEQQVARALEKEVHGFAAQEGSTVLALFTGASTADLPLRRETRSFFRRLSNVRGSSYSERASEISASVLKASLGTAAYR